jgi:hypothetical protein
VEQGWEWWAIQDLNLRLLPCVRSHAENGGTKNKGKAFVTNDLSGFSAFDPSRCFLTFFDGFRYFWAQNGRNFYFTLDDS